MLLDFFHSLLNVLFAHFKLLVLVLEVDKSHSNPVYSTVGSLTELFIFRDFLKEIRKLSMAFELVLTVF